jgi:uncharacterized protein (TIGR02001 family)
LGDCVRRSKSLPAIVLVLGIFAAIAGARADDTETWHAPFGGSFNAALTATTDYSYAGISNNALQPALQPSLDYRTPDLLSNPKLWIYFTLWGSNVVLPAGTGGEVDVSGGVKITPTKELKLDFGYVRVTYPGFAPTLGYDYGDFNINVDYDFGPAVLSGRLRFSPNSFANSGWEFNKRVLLAVPLKFEKVSFKPYGSIGNLSVERYLQYGIPSPDYWYWQLGVVTSAFGLDLTLAYTDTNIEPSGCGNTNNCAARIFASITKAF